MHSMTVRWLVRGEFGLIALTALCLCLAQSGFGCSKCETPQAKRFEMSEDRKNVSAQAPGNKLEDTLDKCNDSNTQFEDALGGGVKAVGVERGSWATKEVGGKKAYLKRTSGNKTFHLTTDGVWLDDSCASAQGGDGKVISVKYLSDEYYNLLKAKPAMEGYFGVGDKVMFTVDGKTYRVDRSGSK